MKKNRSFKTIIIMVLFLVVSSHVTAFELGLKFGINQHTLAFSHDRLQSGFESHSDFIAGAFLNFSISKDFSLQPEIYISRKGSIRKELTSLEDTYYYKYQISSIDIPLLLKYSIPLKGRIQPFLYFGPFVGFKRKATFLRIIDHGEEEQFGEREDINEYINSSDYGLVLGGSLEYRVCFGKLILDIRYNLGMANILKDAAALSELYNEVGLFYERADLAAMVAENDSMKNKALIFMLGIAF